MEYQLVRVHDERDARLRAAVLGINRRDGREAEQKRCDERYSIVLSVPSSFSAAPSSTEARRRLQQRRVVNLETIERASPHHRGRRRHVTIARWRLGALRIV